MRKLNITIIIGVIVALIGAAVVFLYGHDVDQRIADGKQTVAVVVAKQDLASNLRPDQLRSLTEVQRIPRRYVVAGALASIDQAPTTGVLLGPVQRGGQLSSGMFGTPTTAVAVTPPKGNVDIAIQTGLTPGLLRYIGAGSAVDMFVTYGSVTTAAGPTAANPACGVKGGGGACTKLFASGVKVVSVSAATPAQQAGQTGTTTAAQQPVGDQVLCVLEVTPDLAEKIVNAVNGGSIYLALTNPGDLHSTGGTNQADVIGSNR